jgi:hypothetical protein
MSLTVQQARDLQAVIDWASSLDTWEQDWPVRDEPGVATALIRLAYAAHQRLRDTGQGVTGLTGEAVEARPAVQWMLGHGHGEPS